MGLKFLGEGEWKRKKHELEYRCQWRKLHIGIDAKTLQICAVQLTKNNVIDSQVLGDLLAQIPPDEKTDSVLQMELMTRNGADSLFQIVKHMRRFHQEKMQNYGVTKN